jgi:tRNA (cytidine/uridine-2'-O-)-methyltransferase
VIEIALYQPDIAPNTGAILRLAACFGLTVRIIEPAGFVWSDARLRRAGMDYLDHVRIVREPSWEKFQVAVRHRRLILMTTAGDVVFHRFGFETNDVLLMGRESSGVPDHVHRASDARLVIPMRAGLRSLNVAMAAAIVTAEALRQTGGFPPAGGHAISPGS